jgi:single-strand DNA-binding protein
MHGLASISFTGNLCADPERRVTPGGDVVANFRVACTGRAKSSDGGYVDGPTSFFNVAAWRGLGENVLASVRKGDRVTVSGDLTMRPYTTAGGKSDTSGDVQAADVAVSLQFATAMPVKGTTRAVRAVS